MKSWLIRAILITPIMVALALTVKTYLIEPYGVVSLIEFEVQVDRILKKGDREI